MGWKAAQKRFNCFEKITDLEVASMKILESSRDRKKKIKKLIIESNHLMVV